MIDGSVYDVCSPDSAAQRFDTTLDLGKHAASQSAATNEPHGLPAVQLGNQTGRVFHIPINTIYISEIDQFIRSERGSQGTSYKIGVDIIALARFVSANARHNRNEFFFHQVGENPCVDCCHLSDKTEIDLSLSRGLAFLSRDQKVAVLAGEADRQRTMPVYHGYDFLVNLAYQDHLGHIHGGGISHSMPVHDTHFKRHSLHLFRDLRSTPVHDHRVHPHITHEHYIRRDLLLGVTVLHGVAAELHNNRFAVIILYIRQGLHKNACFIYSFFHAYSLGLGFMNPRPMYDIQ